MTRKRALIVDDSKSARVILSRMLEKYGIEVDMAESAEQSIEYLQHNRPDAIFMDQLMPGMDGLQAVQLIKGNPQTAMIPIMMYTSQEGELYVGQARALGAMGVLPKQVRPVDVSKVLYELHLLPDRRDGELAALAPVEVSAAPAAASAAPETGAAPAATVSGAADWSRRLDAAIRDQSADLRRFIVASLDSFATRVVGDVRDLPPRAMPEPPPPAPAAVPPPPKNPGPGLAATAVAALAAVGFAWLWSAARADAGRARAEVSALTAANAQLAAAREELAQTVKQLSAALAGATAGPGATQPPGAAPSAVQSAEVPYGEVPLDRGRLDVMRTLLNKLVDAGFHGVVKVTSYAGQFCLTGNATDGYVPAADNLPMAKCDAVGNPFEDSLSGQQRQSLAFGNLIAGVRERTGGAVAVTIADGAGSRVAVPYPPRTDSLTAGEWNKAAAADNRVEFAVLPAAAPQSATTTTP
ncbi:MAG: response regulator [Gammaproteobacteria bacterium]|nr:response regulator [Gammaproteobacteria bacterium]